MKTMNREIKFEYGFESVNGIVKKIYHLYQIPFISQKCDVWGELPIKYVRQYTGLKDKNSDEYCEGDIIKDGTLNEQIGVVKFKDGCFILEFQDGSYYLLKHYENVGEIIGNIYENTELLTKNEE